MANVNQFDQTEPATMSDIRIGLTESHACSYLPDQLERVAIVLDSTIKSPQNYERLLANGFRRSGSMIYQPYCDRCSSCQAIRLPVHDIQLSKSQKRLLNQSKNVRWEMKSQLDDNWFTIYQHYINARHQHGSMFPPNRNDFLQFSECNWLDTRYLHLYLDNQLMAIAVTDIMPQCASAFYTFYDPDSSLSLGTLAVLMQLEYCKLEHKPWLYLGYQIDECTAMNYKVRFHPHQRLVNQRWQG
jgi:arginine-tRNA-protein transferase